MPGANPLPKPARRVVFLCTGNCIRSQMAEGLLRHLAPGRYRPASGGSDPAGFVHELAVEVLQEIGVDISAYESKPIYQLLPPYAKAPEVLVCLCDFAAARCPDFPDSVKWLCWLFMTAIPPRLPRAHPSGGNRAPGSGT